MIDVGTERVGLFGGLAIEEVGCYPGLVLAQEGNDLVVDGS